MAEHVDPARGVIGDLDEDENVRNTVSDNSSMTTGLDSAEADPTAMSVEQGAPRTTASSNVVAAAFGIAVIVALASLAGWSTFSWQQQDKEQVTRTEVLDAARQGATALTTIDAADIDADVKTILEASTGKFHDSFEERSVPFVEAVRQAQSKTEGTVTAAGIEKLDGAQAQVLVTVSVKTSNSGQPDQEPRSWRMRINVDKDAERMKMSDVQFVP